MSCINFNSPTKNHFQVTSHFKESSLYFFFLLLLTFWDFGPSIYFVGFSITSAILCGKWSPSSEINTDDKKTLYIIISQYSCLVFTKHKILLFILNSQIGSYAHYGQSSKVIFFSSHQTFFYKKIQKILRNFSHPNKNLYFLSGEGFSPTLTDMSIKNVSSLFRRYPLPIIHAVTGGPPLGSSSDASYISQEKINIKCQMTGTDKV